MSADNPTKAEGILEAWGEQVRLAQARLQVAREHVASVQRDLEEALAGREMAAFDVVVERMMEKLSND